MNPIAIEPMTVMGMPPVDFVNLTADLGCDYVTLMMGGGGNDIWSLYPPHSLRDPKVRQEVAAALRDRGLSLYLADGFLVMPDRDVSVLAEDLDIMAGLGAKIINTTSMDPDLSRTFDQTGKLVEMAVAAGLGVTTELCPALSVKDLATALSLLKAVGRPEFNLLLDTMHFSRAGVTAGEVAALDPALIGFVQIADVKRVPDNPDYFVEATTERLVPGTGELDLVGIIAAVPDDVVVSAETPRLAEAKGGADVREMARETVAGTRQVLGEARSRP